MDKAPEAIQIQPQEGPQTAFLASDADVAIYGGSAFAGKTFSLLLDDLRHVHDSGFASVTFRRDTTQIRNPGGLWDEATRLYHPFGAKPLSNSLEQVFPSGAVAKFAHLEYADSVYAWDGAQIPVLKFDQLESFESGQFWYMLSRNRDPSGNVKPYCRATCNPKPGWLADLLSWWINPDTGYAIWERSGVKRWFVRFDETLHWADSKEELFEKFKIPDLPDDDPEQPRPMSLTFIPGRIWDNKIGLRRDPGYLAKLKAQQRVERERLLGDAKLGGNWKIAAAAGLMFRREWCKALEEVPADLEREVRYWDLAGTEKTEANDPDWKVGLKLAKYKGQRRYVILDARRMRESPHKVEEGMLNTAESDGRGTRVGFPQDPGQAGKSQKRALAGLLGKFSTWSWSESRGGDKVTRFGPFSAQCEAGNVDYVKGPWNDAFFSSLENFPDGKHKDDADACSGAYEMLVNPSGGAGLAEHYRNMAQAEADAEAKRKNGAQPREPVPTVAELPVVSRQVKRSSNFAEAIGQV